MADNPFGLSFAPLLANVPQGGSYQPTGGGAPQEAIQLLSLHRPTVYGAQAPAPAALLNSPGSAFLSNLQTLLMALQRGGAAPTGGLPTPPQPGNGGGGNGSPPPPNAGPLPPAFTYPAPRPMPSPSPMPQPPMGMPRGPNQY